MSQAQDNQNMTDNCDSGEKAGNNFPLELSGDDMVPSSGRGSRKDTRLPYFSGCCKNSLCKFSGDLANR